MRLTACGEGRARAQALRRWPSETDFYSWLSHEPALAQPSVVLEYYSRPLLHSDHARAQYAMIR